MKIARIRSEGFKRLDVHLNEKRGPGNKATLFVNLDPPPSLLINHVLIKSKHKFRLSIESAVVRLLAGYESFTGLDC